MISKTEAKKHGFRIIEGECPFAREREEMRATLRHILPMIINGDGNLDCKAAQDVLDIANTCSNDQGYELTFAGKGVARQLAQTPTQMELRAEVAQSKDFDGTGNVIIRADNLDALKMLHQNYHGRVKLIYIDPPYNTQSDNFVYNDNFKLSARELARQFGMDEAAADYLHNVYSDRSHSGWLTFIYPRLILARELLTTDGAIFISIDDNEQANLKILCDEIFGGDNFVACLHVEMSTTQGMKVASAQKGNIVKNAEYILVYARNVSHFSFSGILYEKRDWDGHYSIYYDPKTGEQCSLFEWLRTQKDALGLNGDFRALDIGDCYRNNTQFRDFIHANADKIWQDAMGKIAINLTVAQQQAIDAGEIVAYDAGDRTYYLKKTSTGVIRQLLPLGLAIGDTDGFEKDHGIRKIRGDWWPDFFKDMMNLNKEGGIVYKNGKKPLRLIGDILKIACGKDDLVLDFFAGSGTTAEAVLRANAADGGARKFILVQLDEEIKKGTPTYDFCVQRHLAPVISSIAIERANLAGEKIQAQAQADGKPAPDVGYKVFSAIPQPVWSDGAAGGNIALGQGCGRDSALDTLINMMCVVGQPLHTPIETVLENVLYKAGEQVYALAAVDEDVLAQFKHLPINIDAYANVHALDFVRMGFFQKDGSMRAVFCNTRSEAEESDYQADGGDMPPAAENHEME